MKFYAFSAEIKCIPPCMYERNALRSANIHEIFAVLQSEFWLVIMLRYQQQLNLSS